MAVALIATTYESVHPAYNPSFSACFFSRNNIFSHTKSVNSVFQPAYQPSQTGLYLLAGVNTTTSTEAASKRVGRSKKKKVQT
jgi:hypothetical protein